MFKPDNEICLTPEGCGKHSEMSQKINSNTNWTRGAVAILVISVGIVLGIFYNIHLQGKENLGSIHKNTNRIVKVETEFESIMRILDRIEKKIK